MEQNEPAIKLKDGTEILVSSLSEEQRSVLLHLEEARQEHGRLTRRLARLETTITYYDQTLFTSILKESTNTSEESQEKSSESLAD